MDIVFHASCGVLLASALGERRRPMLVLAGVIASLPDLTLGLSWLVHRAFIPYTVAHSLPVTAAVTAAIMLLNWRIALGLPLHVLIDNPLHSHSQLYGALHVNGVDWWRGYGIPIAITLWAVLIVLAVLHVRRIRRSARAQAEARTFAGRPPAP